jgi:hypothetical protein
MMEKETFYSECCGKLAERHSKDAKDGFAVTGPFPNTGDTYCSRCKRDVTLKGKPRKTAKNDDIDKNGSWEYTLKSVRTPEEKAQRSR